MTLALTGGNAETAEAEILAATKGTDENTTSNPQRIVPHTQQLSIEDNNTIAYTCPAYSVGVIRLHVSGVAPSKTDPLPEPILSFTFEKGKATDDSGTYTCELVGKASIVTLEDGNHALATGGKGEGSYMDIPATAAKQTLASVKDYTISINMLQRSVNNTAKFCWAYSMEQGTDQYIGLVNTGGINGTLSHRHQCVEFTALVICKDFLPFFGRVLMGLFHHLEQKICLVHTLIVF